MPNTPNQGYPYPGDTDDIDVPDDLEKLALAIDDDVFDAVTLLDGKVSIAGDTMTGMLTLPGTNPTSLNHAVRKGYADAAYLQADGGNNMTDDLDMNFHKILHLDPPTEDTDAARKSYVDNVFADAVKKNVTTNQTVGGPLHAKSFTVTSEDEPSGPWHCTPKNYVDALVADVGGMTQAQADARYVNVQPSGDIMNGPLQIGEEWDAGESGMVLRPRGTIRVSQDDPADGPTLLLNRFNAANAAGGVYISFNFSDDQEHGTIEIQTDGSGIDVTGTSDYRMKDRLAPITDAAQRVQTLAGHAFRGRWKGHQLERDMLNAHDVGEVAPYAVYGDKDGEAMQRLAPTALVPLLVAALGNALDRIDELEARLA